MKCECCNDREATKKKLCDICDDNMKAMAGMDELMNEEIDKQAKQDSEFLESVNYLFSKRVKDFFDGEMEEIAGCGFELVDEHKGEKQRHTYAIDYYVDQRGVGDSGDSFEGNCYLRLANNKYLKWSYEC